MNRPQAQASDICMQTLRRWAALAVWGLCAVASASANGAATDDDAVREDLAACAARTAAAVQKHYESVRDLEARFTQSTRSVAFGSGAVASAGLSTGHVVFAKPGRMRWTYEAPQPSLVVSDGRILWIYDPEAREAQRLPVTQGYMTGAGLSFLVGDGELTSAFEIRASDCTGDEVELDLLPLEDASYERLGLRVVRATGEVRATSIVDLFGNVTVLEFEGLETNRDPAGDVFEFDPPKDVRVIDLTQQGIDP